MSGTDARDHEPLDRRTELEVDLVLDGLGDVDRAELQEMNESGQVAGLEVVVAEVARAMVDPVVPMPADVADRTRRVLARRQQERALADRVRPVTERSGDRAASRAGTIGRALGGFAAAAAVVLLALVITRNQFAPTGPAVPLTVSDARAALVSRATDLVTLRWQGTDHPDIRRARDMGLVGGEVIWSDDESEGFVRVCHLGINDPATGSYRVWIWNADAADDAPVAACRFDVTQVSDFTVVPIEAAAAAGIRGPVRASVTLVETGADAGTGVDRPDPADELLVARLVVPLPRPGASSDGGSGRG